MEIIVLHDAAADDAVIDRRVEEIRMLAGPTNPVTSARDAFFDYEKQVGGKIRGFRWNDWTTHVTERFDAFIRPDNVDMGRINADIMGRALLMQKRVLFATEAGVYGVKSIITVNPDNWRSGWKLKVNGDP